MRVQQTQAQEGGLCNPLTSRGENQQGLGDSSDKQRGLEPDISQRGGALPSGRLGRRSFVLILLWVNFM